MSIPNKVTTQGIPDPSRHATASRAGMCADLVSRHKYHAIAEIGVWKGDFAKAFLTACHGITKYWMIDPWRRLPHWNKPFNVSDEEFEAIYREALAATESHAAVRRVLRGTTAEVIDQIPDGSLDFAYIDGDHTLRGITLDLLLVWPKIRAGGAIGGDDCCPTAWQHGLAYEPTMVSPWVAYFAEAMRAPITILPGNQFLIEKRSGGFTLTDQSHTVREWSVRAHFGSSMGPLRGTERGAAFRAINAIKRCTVGDVRRRRSANGIAGGGSERFHVRSETPATSSSTFPRPPAQAFRLPSTAAHLATRRLRSGRPITPGRRQACPRSRSSATRWIAFYPPSATSRKAA